MLQLRVFQLFRTISLKCPVYYTNTENYCYYRFLYPNAAPLYLHITYRVAKQKDLNVFKKYNCLFIVKSSYPLFIHPIKHGNIVLIFTTKSLCQLRLYNTN